MEYSTLALTGLLAADGQLGSALVSLGKKAFIFSTIESDSGAGR